MSSDRIGGTLNKYNPPRMGLRPTKLSRLPEGAGGYCFYFYKVTGKKTPVFKQEMNCLPLVKNFS